MEIVITDETLQAMFLQAMHGINDVYLEGTIKYTEDNHKDLNAKIDSANNRINQVWQECLNGKASLEEFKAALASYKSLCMKGMELSREHLTTKVGNDKVENETLCRRCGKPSERFCYGEDKSGEYKFGDFCLECRPN